MTDTVRTTDEVAVTLGVSTWMVRKLARDLGVGYNVGGKSGWKFSPADIDAMRDSMRPAAPAPARRRRRRAS